MKLEIAFILLVIVMLTNCNLPTNHVEIQFLEQITNTDASLRALHVVDEHVIWASGSEGTVLVSKDGGESWKVHQISGAEKNDFRSIHAWDENRAMVFGVLGPEFGFKTEDGGETWDVIFQDTTKGLFFNNVYLDFYNEIKEEANTTWQSHIGSPIEFKPYILTNHDDLNNKEILVQDLKQKPGF